MTFFQMGGYALYVWPCFVISAVTLLALYLQSRQRLKTVERELALAEAARSDRRPARAARGTAEDSLS